MVAVASFKVAAVGCTECTGGEVLRLLLQHPGVETGVLTDNSSAGDRPRDHQPHLAPFVDRGMVATIAENLADYDIAFLVLPYGVSAGIAGQFGAETLVINAEADFQLRDSGQQRRFYGSEHVGTWPYSLPRLPGRRDVLRSAGWTAVPDCYPTTVTLVLFPAVQVGLIDPAGIVVVAASKISGAEKVAKSHLLGPEIVGSASVYGVSGVHRHIPEIIQSLSAVTDKRVDVPFIPMLVPTPRGILATCTVPRANDTAAGEVWRCYEVAYIDEPFINSLPRGIWSVTAGALGFSRTAVQVVVDEIADRAVVILAINNLTKDTASDVVQSMNITLGLDETIGLNMIGVVPWASPLP